MAFKKAKKKKKKVATTGEGGFRPSSVFRHNATTGENKAIYIRFWDTNDGEENLMFEAKTWSKDGEGERISTKLEAFEAAMLAIEFSELAGYEMRKKHNIPKREMLQALNDPDVRRELKKIIAEVIMAYMEEDEEYDEEEEEEEEE